MKVRICRIERDSQQSQIVYHFWLTLSFVLLHFVTYIHFELVLVFVCHLLEFADDNSMNLTITEQNIRNTWKK